MILNGDNLFADFDQDSSGDIGLTEFRAALQALGQELTATQVDQLTADADLDLSGHIDFQEFSTFLQPYMCITQSYRFPVKKRGVGRALFLSVTSMGTQLSDKEGYVTERTETIGFPRTANFEADTQAGVFKLTVKDPNASTCSILAFETPEAESIVTVMKQQLAKQELRRQVALHKQKLEMLNAFHAVDLSGDGLIDLRELRTLLLSLGKEHTDAELRDIMRNEAGENSKIDFDFFSALMIRWQEEELRDLFDFFDDDGSGTISVAELSTAIQALGEHDGTNEEADELAAYVDSDGSGSIDVDEFCVFLRPMLKITQLHEFYIWYVNIEQVVPKQRAARLGRRRNAVVSRSNSYTDMTNGW